MSEKPIMHGRDHRPGGMDPIPGLPSTDRFIYSGGPVTIPAYPTGTSIWWADQTTHLPDTESGTSFDFSDPIFPVVTADGVYELAVEFEMAPGIGSFNNTVVCQIIWTPLHSSFSPYLTTQIDLRALNGGSQNMQFSSISGAFFIPSGLGFTATAVWDGAGTIDLNWQCMVQRIS